MEQNGGMMKEPGIGSANELAALQQGAALSASQIRALIQTKPPLIENLVDLDTQLQPNGIDLTVGELERFVDAGRVDFSNAERTLSKTIALEFEDDWLFLGPGVYKVRFNEEIHLPRDLLAIGAPRTTLLRCGVSIETGIWDAGFEGRSEALLVVFNEAGFSVKRNARILQMVFIKLSEPTSGGYRGIYSSLQSGRD